MGIWVYTSIKRVYPVVLSHEFLLWITPAKNEIAVWSEYPIWVRLGALMLYIYIFFFINRNSKKF